MSSIVQNSKSFENDLSHSISEYNGYQFPADRIKSDKRLREFISERLEQIETELSQFEHRFYQKNKNANLNPFHRISLNLKVLIQSLLELSDRENHFFVQSKIDQDKNAQLQELDVQLVNQVDILVDEVKELDNINGDYEIDDMLNHFYDLLDGVNQVLSEREFLMLSE